MGMGGSPFPKCCGQSPQAPLLGCGSSLQKWGARLKSSCLRDAASLNGSEGEMKSGVGNDGRRPSTLHCSHFSHRGSEGLSGGISLSAYQSAQRQCNFDTLG
eukprot:EG_transcript_22402